MFRAAAFAVAAVGIALSGCTPTTAFHGFQAVEANPKDVKVGEDTKSTVLTQLGSPSVVSTFEPNIWYYISQRTDKYAFYNPRIMSRDVVSITFNEADEKVTAVNTFDLEDGKVIAFNSRETPTRGRELSVLEQLLGNVGRGGMLPRDDSESYPGGRRGD